MAASYGWDNYRHQADVLAQYQLLRANGVPDDRIVLVLADDLARNPKNTEQGTVRNEAAGPNLYTNVEIDYRLNQVTAEGLLSILAGEESAALPEVIDSGPGDNIYVCIVGHGNENGVYLGLDQAIPASGGLYSILEPASLAQTVSSMSQQDLYRRMLIAVESCHGGIMGSALDAPGAILFSGANPFENSLSANYDLSQRIWLADEFAYHLWEIALRTPDMSLADVYKDIYLKVNGSHASAYGPAFGETDEVSLGEFLRP